MAWYGWALALCGKLAPMLSGFINFGLGWKWTLWRCAIWNAMCFVYCFFLLEETNYDRVHASSSPPAPEHTTTSLSAPANPELTVSEKDAKNSLTVQTALSDSGECGEVHWARKTYMQKLGLMDKKRPNRLVSMMKAPFKGFTYPAVVYAGYVHCDSHSIPD